MAFFFQNILDGYLINYFLKLLVPQNLEISIVSVETYSESHVPF